jgi:hypothetical protein
MRTHFPRVEMSREMFGHNDVTRLCRWANAFFACTSTIRNNCCKERERFNAQTRERLLFFLWHRAYKRATLRTTPKRDGETRRTALRKENVVQKEGKDERGEP